MRKLVALAALAAGLGTANIALAAASVPLQTSEEAQHEAAYKMYYDHPATQVVESKDVKVTITKDSIMRSCCMPPNLVVAGNVTNTATKPLNYVEMIFSFEDSKGKIVHAETVYNLKAQSLSDDEEVGRLLNEKPHFQPLPPGSSDRFSFSIPTTVLPSFSKVELYTRPVMQ